MKRERFFREGYIGSTRAELDHQLGSNVTPLRLALRGIVQFGDLARVAEESKKRFIDGLQGAKSYR